MTITRLVRWAVMGIIIVLVSFFSQANRGMVTVSFWPFAADMTAPMALVILGSVIFGAAAGIILCGVSLIKWRLRAKKYQKRVLVLERQHHQETNRDLTD